MKSQKYKFTLILIGVLVVITGIVYFLQSNGREQDKVNQNRVEKVSNWPVVIPKEVPPLETAKVDKITDLTTQGLVEGQPEKMLYVVELSEFTSEEIREYIKNLQTNWWKVESVTYPKTESLVHRAAKGDYVVVIEENTYGTSTAYYYVNLTEEATGIQYKTAP